MNYKKIKENKILIFIDSVFRFFGFYFEIQVDMVSEKIKLIKLRKLYK